MVALARRRARPRARGDGTAVAELGVEIVDLRGR